MKKILIFRNTSLGDFIVGIPAIKIINKKFLDHKIYYLSLQHSTKKGAINANEILGKDNLIKEYIFFNKNELSIFRSIKLIKKIRKYKFEKFFYLNENTSKIKLFRDFLFFSFCNIKKIYGFDFFKMPNYAEGNESFHIAKRVDKNIEVKNIKNLLKNSYKINKRSQFLTLRKFLSKKNYKKFITISTGMRNLKKDWGLKNWKILLKNIFYYYPSLKIIIVGSKKEYRRAERLKRIKFKNVINLCGKTNIKELMEIVNKSKFHISHDDGTMHVASIFKKKNIAIFSNIQARGQWFPTNSNSIVFYPEVSIKEITPNLVIKQFRKNFS